MMRFENLSKTDQRRWLDKARRQSRSAMLALAAEQVAVREGSARMSPQVVDDWSPSPRTEVTSQVPAGSVIAAEPPAPLGLSGPEPSRVGCTERCGWGCSTPAHWGRQASLTEF